MYKRKATVKLATLESTNSERFEYAISAVKTIRNIREE